MIPVLLDPLSVELKCLVYYQPITTDGICFRQCYVSGLEVTDYWPQKFQYYYLTLIF